MRNSPERGTGRPPLFRDRIVFSFTSHESRVISRDAPSSGGRTWWGLAVPEDVSTPFATPPGMPTDRKHNETVLYIKSPEKRDDRYREHHRYRGDLRVIFNAFNDSERLPGWRNDLVSQDGVLPRRYQGIMYSSMHSLDSRLVVVEPSLMRRLFQGGRRV